MDVKTSKNTPAGGRRSSASNNSGEGTSAVVERKEMEKKRRQNMKNLCIKLASLIPKEHYSSKDGITELGCLDEATAYIKKLKERVDELQQKRDSAQILARTRGGGGGASTSAAMTMSGGTRSESSSDGAAAAEAAAAEPPVVEVRHHDHGSSLDVVLISSVERQFKMHEVVTVLEEEGAEVINANFSVSGCKIFYTIHARAFSSRIGIDVSRISERLRALV